MSEMPLPSLALRMTEELAGFALILQAAELWSLRAHWSDRGLWRWRVIREDFRQLPAVLRLFFDVALAPRQFGVLLLFQILGAAALMGAPLPGLGAGLFFVALTICARWRGAFNGGSDYMMLQILFIIGIAGLYRHDARVVDAGLSYLAVQAATSYFVGGFVKLKSANWRGGRALPAFLASAVYGPGTGHYDSQSAARNETPPGPETKTTPAPRAFLSWVVIFFECTFPVALFDLRLTIAYTATALVFHIANFYFFGLNRFFWAWLAAYPALFYFVLAHPAGHAR